MTENYITILFKNKKKLNYYLNSYESSLKKIMVKVRTKKTLHISEFQVNSTLCFSVDNTLSIKVSSLFTKIDKNLIFIESGIK